MLCLRLIFNIILGKDRKIRVEAFPAKHYSGQSFRKEGKNHLGSMNSNQLGLLIILSLFWAVRPSFEALAAVVGIAVISTAAAYLLYFYLLAAVGATNVLLVTFLIPVSALLLGVGVLNETIKMVEYAGMGCIFLGLIIIDGRVFGWLQDALGKECTVKTDQADSCQRYLKSPD